MNIWINCFFILLFTLLLFIAVYSSAAFADVQVKEGNEDVQSMRIDFGPLENVQNIDQ